MPTMATRVQAVRHSRPRTRSNGDVNFCNPIQAAKEKYQIRVEPKRLNNESRFIIYLLVFHQLVDFR